MTDALTKPVNLGRHCVSRNWCRARMSSPCQWDAKLRSRPFLGLSYIGANW